MWAKEMCEICYEVMFKIQSHLGDTPVDLSMSECFQRPMTEKGRPTLSVGSTILWLRTQTE